MNFQTKIAKIRKDSGLTQEEFAAKLFVTRQAVSRWEQGETTPNLETIQKILQIFNLDANSLFFGSVCQSCSCPMVWDEKTILCGTNPDGGISLDYCSHCYKDGKFQSYETLEEAIADSVNYAEAAGMTTEQMIQHAKTILPTLKRWVK